MALQAVTIAEDISTVSNGSTYRFGVPVNVDRPTALVTVKIDNTGNNPDVIYKMQGSLDGTNFYDVKKADHSTAATWDAAGATVSTYDYVELWPYMRLICSEATAAGAGFTSTVTIYADARFSG